MILKRLLLSLVLILPASSGVALADAARPEGFAAHFHRDDVTVIVVEDPLPHLRTLLNSPLLRRLMTDGALGKMMSRGGEPLDPAAGWQWVNENRRWVPQQLAVGLSDAGVADFDHLLQLLAIFELQQAAVGGDDDDAKLREERKVLRRQLAELLPSIQLPRMRIYVRFRDGEDANALLELARLQLDEIPKDDLPPGLTFENNQNRLTAKLVLDEMLRAQNIDAQDLLSGMGLVDVADGVELTRKAVDAVRNFKAEISLEQFGAGLLLTVGPTATGGPAGLPPEFANLPAAVGKPDKSTLLWGRWSATRLKSAAAAWMALHERWRPSASYKLAGEDPLATESLVETLYDLAIRVRKLADGGAMRIWADEKSSAIRLAMQSEPTAPAADLAGSTLAKLLPDDVDGFSVQTDTSLGQWVSDQLMQVEERMATRALKADIAGGADFGAARMELGYYEHFSAMRELIHRAGLDRFHPGYAVLMGTKGKVARFEASLEFKAQSQRLSGRDLPTPELALIGRPKIGDIAMRTHVEQVYGAMIRGVRSASRVDGLANQPIPLVDAKAIEVDHGLGVPTWTFDVATLTKASGEAKLRIDVTGDLRPHFFFVEGHVVFSTSPRLSKQIVAAHGGKAKRLTLPEDDEDLVGIGRMTGSSLATMMRQFKGWYLALADKVDDGDGADPLAMLLDATAEMSAAIDKVEWTTLQPVNERRQVTEGVVLFKDDRR